MSHLAVGDGHDLWFEVSGDPEGIPVLCLHGGPGAGSDPGDRALLDSSRYRTVLLDQRGCGRSRPFASTEANTTWHLVSDIERLRQHLGVEKWTLFGGSWGSTLALAYAETHPERVHAMLLRGVFLLRPEELDWFYRDGASRFHPEAWARFAIAGADDLVAAYHARLSLPDAAEAARAWCLWEATACSFLPSAAIADYLTDPERSLALARLETHYFVHGAWLEGRALLANIDRIRHIPTIVVQGRYDLVCPPRSAWDLQRAWPELDLRIIDATGHISQEPAIARALRAASTELAVLTAL